MSTHKIVLAGPGATVVNLVLLPAFQRPEIKEQIAISGICTEIGNLKSMLNDLKPDVLVVDAMIAARPADLLSLLSDMDTWYGVAVIVVPEAYVRFKALYLDQAYARVVRRVLAAESGASIPDLAQITLDVALQAQAEAPARAVPAPAVLAEPGLHPASVSSGIVSATRRIAVMSHSGGVGTSTIAEGLAYELANRYGVQPLLVSGGSPPVAAAHFRNVARNMTAAPFFVNPTRNMTAQCIQPVDKVDLLLAPLSSDDYLQFAWMFNMREKNSVHSLLMSCEDGRHPAIIVDTPTSENMWKTHAALFANLAILVYRPTIQDVFAAAQTLSVLTGPEISRAGGVPPDAIYLVLNRRNEASSIQPRQFLEELEQVFHWAPAILAVIDEDMAIQQAHESRLPPTQRSEKLSRGIRQIIATLFPGLKEDADAPAPGKRAQFRLPRIAIG